MRSNRRQTAQRSSCVLRPYSPPTSLLPTKPRPPTPHLLSYANRPHRNSGSEARQGKATRKGGNGKQPRGNGMDSKPAAAAAARRKKDASKKRQGGGGGGGGSPRGTGVSPAAPPADAATGSGAAMAECAAACCVLCACLPVAVLCCVARAPLRVARRCCGRWRRRGARRRLAPGGSSSFSDAEVGEFLQGGGGARRRAMGQEGSQPSPRGGRTTSPPAPPRDRRR